MFYIWITISLQKIFLDYWSILCCWFKSSKRFVFGFNDSSAVRFIVKVSWAGFTTFFGFQFPCFAVAINCQCIKYLIALTISAVTSIFFWPNLWLRMVASLDLGYFFILIKSEISFHMHLRTKRPNLIHARFNINFIDRWK